MITPPSVDEEIETLDDDISIFNFETPKPNDLKETINKIRSLITELNDDNIKIEEIDLENFYQINIMIAKD